MKDAEGAAEGAGVGAEEVNDVWVGSQFLDLSSVKMRRRIMSSGTRLPDFMASSASRPAKPKSKARVSQGALRWEGPIQKMVLFYQRVEMAHLGEFFGAHFRAEGLLN